VSHINQLTRIFAGSRDRREAHARAAPVLAAMSHDADFFSSCLERWVSQPGVLNTRHYPVLAVPIARTRDFELVANCWIPLPGGNTNMSTKSIHHHGHMLLTTVTNFGPGYEHWLFSPPRQVDEEHFTTTLLDRAPHVPHKPAFVDARVAHVPFYPRTLSITLALWSHENAATWLDALKQWQMIQRHKDTMISAARAVGLASRLNINIVEYFDFFPSDGRLKVIKDRVEFQRGPNANFLHSMFHVLQQTQNQRLGRVISRQLERDSNIENRPLIERLVQRLERDEPIEGRLSEGHYGLTLANFTREAVELVIRRS
jgi:hypothetical protein